MRPTLALLIAALGALAVIQPQAHAAGAGSLSDRAEVAGGGLAFPAVGEALVPKVRARRKPRGGSERLATMPQFRFDHRPTVFYLLRSRRNQAGETWYRISVPGRPNGRKGWVRSSQIRLRRSVGRLEIVIDRSALRLKLKRGAKKLLAAPVAVGTADAPTPLGRFYVTARFRPGNPFLGPWAFETSAYAAITDWPRGGIVGLHGTNLPSSVGTRASHGCLRVYNSVIRALKRRVRPGTPIVIKR
ncbi:MAG: L,D-transpeptidase [Solirubrobacterales bacterium]